MRNTAHTYSNNLHRICGTRTMNGTELTQELLDEVHDKLLEMCGVNPQTLRQALEEHYKFGAPHPSDEYLPITAWHEDD